MTISKTEQILSLLFGNLSLGASAALRTDLEASAEGRELLAEYEALAAFLAAEGGTEPSVESVNRARRLLKQSRPGLVERTAGAVRTFVASLDFDSRFSELAGFSWGGGRGDPGRVLSRTLRTRYRDAALRGGRFVRAAWAGCRR